MSKTNLSKYERPITNDAILALALARDEAVPLNAYDAFCSRAHFYSAYFPAGLPSTKIDGQRCVRPSDFFEYRSKINAQKEE